MSLVLTLSSCAETSNSDPASVQPVSTDKSPIATVNSGTISVDVLCASIRKLLEVAEWSQYGVRVDNCGSQPDDNGDEVMILMFNDPAEWGDLIAAWGDLPPEEAAKYAFWRLPLGLLSTGFYDSKKNPEDFKDIYIYFDNPKQTSYGIVPRDISWAVDIPESFSKEAFSKELNSRIDEISERVEVINLNE